MEVAEGYNEMAVSFYGALMTWTWWQRGELIALEPLFRDVVARPLIDYPIIGAVLALIHAEAGDADRAMKDLHALAGIGWEVVAKDQTEGISLALAAAACGVLGSRSRDYATTMYEQMRPYAGTTFVIRAPAAGCSGPADHYLGLLAAANGDLALAEVHFEAALRQAYRMSSPPFAAAAEVELARTLRQRGREGEGERIAVLLRNAEETAIRLGLHRLSQMAADRVGASAGVRSRRGAILLGTVRDGRQLVVGLADAPAHAEQDRVAEARDLHHGVELVGPHDEHVEVRGRRHRRAARRRFDGRQLPEVVAGAPLVHDAAGPGDDDGALEDDEQLPTETALAEDDLTVVHVQTLGDADDLCELVVRAGGEPRHAVQALHQHRRRAPVLCCHPTSMRNVRQARRTWSRSRKEGSEDRVPLRPSVARSCWSRASPSCASTSRSRVAMALNKRVAEARDLGHGGELAWPDDQDVHLGDGGHRCVAGPGIHGRQLTEEVARAECVRPAAALGSRPRSPRG